ncbi:MAG: response regulator [FCB group bacterium]|nr:response regulator [FCB group bacterium]MBL7026962.1 response regulator [Candidatus Neomarinimicrobiota bacterium]MBL7122142.1 response regulator [Candidatus Neomarinimicrobiota bacterium]
MSKKSKKILIVEDDISSQQYYSFIFADKYEIRMVSTITEAKKALEEESFGIALIDFSLPGGENGLDLIRFLQQEYPEGNPVAIALTAHVFPQNQVEALEAGAAEFLTKPIMSRVLLDIIAKYI